ncbi:MAG TPA: dTDP-4-dehydrorhamnose reductase [Acidimicrobiales bacterium]|nr:dTDP-4-dehydrorhamnose reductase [Acidimicrobiales bacterium]
MRVLITGADGLLGRELVEAFDGHDVVATGRRQLDVEDRDSVLQVVTSARPDAVVHAAAWTDVDGCELDPDRALRVNALGTRHAANAARWAGARVCYVSTDYVFSGEAHRPYDEWDRTGPISSYGRSKLGGERELGPEDTIVRTSWLSGRHGRSFVKTVLRLAGQKDEITVVDDQWGRPTFAEDLAPAIAQLVCARLPGTYHVTNQGVATWCELAQATLAAAGDDPDRVRPITTAELDPPRPAPRPRRAVLDNAALRLSGMDLLPDFHDPLERLVKELTGSGWRP